MKWFYGIIILFFAGVWGVTMYANGRVDGKKEIRLQYEKLQGERTVQVISQEEIISAELHGLGYSNSVFFVTADNSTQFLFGVLRSNKLHSMTCPIDERPDSFQKVRRMADRWL